MRTNRYLQICLLILIVLSLTACERDLPAPESAATATTGPPQDVEPGTTPMIDILNQQATQTALAQLTPLPPVEGLTPEVPPAGETPVATAPLVTPEVPPAAHTATVPPPVVDVPAITVPATYTLQGGEFPYCIARRFDVDPGELLKLNGMSSTSIYYSGMTLQIPQSGQSFPGNRSLQPHPATYTIRAGDSLSKIACYYGAVAPEQIAAANGMTPPYKLTPGQVINIP